MSDFVASRDLSPEAFAIFSQQHLSTISANRSRLTDARDHVATYSKKAQWHLEQINRAKTACLKHGIEIPG